MCASFCYASEHGQAFNLHELMQQERNLKNENVRLSGVNYKVTADELHHLYSPLDNLSRWVTLKRPITCYLRTEETSLIQAGKGKIYKPANPGPSLHSHTLVQGKSTSFAGPVFMRTKRYISTPVKAVGLATVAGAAGAVGLGYFMFGDWRK